MTEISEYTNIDVIECKCGTRSCINCGEGAHAPATCNQIYLWNEKEKSESENISWIKSYTKPCGKCGVNIEKNQGCNHMTCNRCRHEFCWLCLRDWKKHTWDQKKYGHDCVKARMAEDPDFAKWHGGVGTSQNEL